MAAAEVEIRIQLRHRRNRRRPVQGTGLDLPEHDDRRHLRRRSPEQPDPEVRRSRQLPRSLGLRRRRQRRRRQTGGRRGPAGERSRRWTAPPPHLRRRYDAAAGLQRQRRRGRSGAQRPPVDQHRRRLRDRRRRPGRRHREQPLRRHLRRHAGRRRSPELSIDRTRLARPVGSQLSCKGTARYVIAEGSFDFRWLRNGVPIEGATGQTYTTTAADSGKAVQCEVEATYENDEPFQHAWATNNDYALIGSTPAPPPPLPPAEIASPSGPALIGAPSGHLTCDAGTWQNGPTELPVPVVRALRRTRRRHDGVEHQRTRAERRRPRRRRDLPVQGHRHQRRRQCRDVERSRSSPNPTVPPPAATSASNSRETKSRGGGDEQHLDQGQRRRPVRGLQADRHLQSRPRRTEHGAILETAGRRCRQLAGRRRRRLGRGRSQLPDPEAHSGRRADPRQSARA